MSSYQVFKSGPRKGQPKTMTDRVVRYLVEVKQAVEIKSRTRYRQFTVKGLIGQFYFVGRAGGVRLGSTVSNSSSWTTHIHNSMKIWESRLQECVDKCNKMLEHKQ